MKGGGLREKERMKKKITLARNLSGGRMLNVGGDADVEKRKEAAAFNFTPAYSSRSSASSLCDLNIFTSKKTFIKCDVRKKCEIGSHSTKDPIHRCEKCDGARWAGEMCFVVRVLTTSLVVVRQIPVGQVIHSLSRSLSLLSPPQLSS